MSIKEMLEDYLNSGSDVEVLDSYCGTLLSGTHRVESIEDDVYGAIKARVTTTQEGGCDEECAVKIKTIDLMCFIYGRQS